MKYRTYIWRVIAFASIASYLFCIVQAHSSDIVNSPLISIVIFGYSLYLLRGLILKRWLKFGLADVDPDNIFLRLLVYIVAILCWVASFGVFFGD